ncbi:hypothetical protein RA224_21775 [Achromobacter aegrifaciens]|uniref:hypothetical protein n=1 Tax=Achromobacter aegrifaciens TaxID=1287736 RepID=UPI0027BA4F1B|nr:hypothetical protein [Achromobacter aegrifaciens]WLW59848.1 hypothetical protein RA224_21775 [Achromobacter aegrifaciens]
MTIPVAFQGEVMLAGWSQTHNGGAKVTFWLSDEDDLAAFKAMTVAKGKTAGQRLALVAVEIGDDERPVVSTEREASGIVSQESANSADKVKGDKLSWLAIRLCRNSDFLEWIGMESEEVAADHIRSVCEIGSRSDLDHDVAAAYRFHEQIRKPFREWMESRK